MVSSPTQPSPVGRAFDEGDKVLFTTKKLLSFPYRGRFKGGLNE